MAHAMTLPRIGAALLLGAVACGGDAPEPEPEPEPDGTAWSWTGPAPKHVLLIVTDTTRADLLREARTPHLDALASAGARVERAWAAGTWTVPSVVSLFTGLPVPGHGWDGPTGRMGSYPPLPATPTLAEVLRGAGFATSGLYANPYLAEKLGFARGFDVWRRSGDPRIPEQFAAQVAEEWGDGRRHFAYVHLIGPHSPLRPSPEAAAHWKVDPKHLEDPRGLLIGAAKRDREGDVRRAYGRAYRAAIEDTDARIGAIVDALGDHRGDTLIVVTSDHGELLGEHDRVGHGHHVWEALTWVPLIVDHPQVPGSTEALPEAASNVAVADLITRATGVDHDWGVAITDPLPLFAQREGRVAISPDGRYKSLWDEDLGGGQRTHDLQADPDEAAPLQDAARAARHLADRGAFVEAWQQTRAALASGGSVELSEEEKAQLRAMGYLDGPEDDGAAHPGRD